MLEPLDAQNMIARTPGVEKTVAAHREDLPQAQKALQQIQRERLHADENVSAQKETPASEKTKDPGPRHPKRRPGTPRPAAPQGQNVELVREAADEPEHQVDVDL
jgi:hypothetical protein